MKKIRYLLIIIILSLAFISNCWAVESVNINLKIYDYGDLLTDEEEKEIKTSIDEYIDEYNFDMVIVTQKDYIGDLRAYGQDFYDYNDFGMGTTKDGILLVLNVDNEGPIAEIVTTGEAIRMYDDSRIDSILTGMSNAKYLGSKAIIMSFIEDSSRFASYGIPSSNKNIHIEKDGNPRPNFPLTTVIVIAIIISTIAIAIMVRKNKMVRKAHDADSYLVKQSVNIYNRSDQFLTTHTSRVNVPSSSSGGRVGGSSISHGSSGRSHGGGGRRL